jgi:hypothetical protein
VTPSTISWSRPIAWDSPQTLRFSADNALLTGAVI